MRPPSRAPEPVRAHRVAQVGTVLCLHALLLWGLHLALRQPPPSTEADAAARRPALQWLIWPPVTPPPPPPLARPWTDRATRSRPTPVTPADGRADPWPHPAPQLPTSPISTTAAPQATVPEPPASAPPARLLDTAASRSALRQLARQPLLQERAAQATGQDLQRSDRALSQAVSGAAHGDCLRGEYAGAGLGLLSLPALAYAEATGRCGR